MELQISLVLLFLFCVQTAFAEDQHQQPEVDLQNLECNCGFQQECKATVPYNDIINLEKKLCDKKVEVIEEKLKSAMTQMNLNKVQCDVNYKMIRENSDTKLARCEDQKVCLQVNQELHEQMCDFRIQLASQHLIDGCNCTNQFLEKQTKLKPTPNVANKLVSLFSGKKYFISIERLNWYMAMQRCKISGMELVSVETKLENDELERLIADYKDHFWTSGTDLGSEGKFYWATSGQPFGLFNDFFAGQPNAAANNNEHCVHFHHSVGGQNVFAWNDFNCDSAFRFICELEQ